MNIFSDIWNSILINPLLNLLFLFYKYVGNMGVAIILLSLLVKVVTLPQALSSMKLMKKQRELMPELDKIKKKFGHDKQKLAEEQMKLYQTAGINPAAGCLTQIFPILIFIALFGVINMLYGTHHESLSSINAKLYFDFLRLSAEHALDSRFFYLDLSKPDNFFILPVFAAILQFLTSKMMMPVVDKAEKAAKKAGDDQADLMYNMQEQTLYMMPIIFLIVGFSLPSGVVLNMVVSTLFSLVQQYYVSGLGGLAPWAEKIGIGKAKIS
jgi:YidC/Oxa1 family membrane protein insertase